MGSSGGGSASGRVDYPEYMKTFHGVALDNSGVDTISVSLADAMNYALDGSSPYSSAVTLSAGDVLLGTGNAITDFGAPFDALAAYTGLNFDTLFTTYTNNALLSAFVSSKTTRIAALISAESALLDDDINTSTLPQFKAGLRDIGAVMSSAFVIGEANIWSGKAKALAKTDAIIRWEAEKVHAELVVKLDDFAARTAINYIEVKKGIAAMSADFAKLYATMHSELLDFDLENEAKDKLWDLKVFQYGGNFLGSIAGSAVATDKGDAKAQRLAGTMSGTMAGAGLGYMAAYATVGASAGPMGAAIGAVVGGVAGYFMS